MSVEMKRTSTEIRELFLDFFAGKEVQETLTNFGTSKFHFNRHHILLYQ